MFITVVLIITCCSIEAVSSAGFERALSLYKNHSFSADDRQFFMNTRYFNQWPDVNVDGLLDTTSFETYGIFTSLGYRKQNFSQNAGRVSRQNISVDAGYLYNKSSYWLGGYKYSDSSAQQFDQKDTVNHVLELDFSYKKQIKEFTGANSGFLSPFFKLGVELDGLVFFDREENFEPPFHEPLTVAGYIRRDLTARGQAQISPGIGIGRQEDVSYVYYAVILEKYLLQNGIINFRLSEKSIKDAAILLSEYDTHKLKNVDTLKALKSSMDSIILSDASGNRDMIRRLSPFWLKKLIFHTTRHFMSGPQLFLESVQSIEPALVYQNFKITSNKVFSYEDTLEDTLRKYSEFNYNTYLALKMRWGMPLTRYCFLSLKSNKILLHKSLPQLYYSRGKLSAEKITELRWDLDAFFPLNHWIMIRAGFRDIPAHIVIPKDYPYHSYLSFDIFVEDYITFQFGISFYHLKEPHRYIYSGLSGREERYLYHGYLPSLKLIYQF